MSDCKISLFTYFSVLDPLCLENSLLFLGLLVVYFPLVALYIVLETDVWFVELSLEIFLFISVIWIFEIASNN